MSIGGRSRRKRDPLQSGGVPRRPAADLLMIAVDEILVRLETLKPEGASASTPCSEWSIRDVVAHCSGTLNRVVTGRLHTFTPRDNDDDVLERRKWTVAKVLEELNEYSRPAAAALGAAGGTLDGVGIGVWVHLGDVRAGLEEDQPYDSAGYRLALDVLQARAKGLKVNVRATVDRHTLTLGKGVAPGQLVTDRDTFVRLIGGRSPDADRYTLVGAEPDDLIMFG